MKYLVNVGATENVLADGRVMVPGEPLELKGDAAKDPHNARLISEGQIVEFKEKGGGS
jgi:hypothetical protein